MLAAWRAAGPRRVQAAVAEHLRRHADQGLFAIGDEWIAALHLIQLTAGTVSAVGVDADVERLVRAGVRTFLAAYHRA